MSNLIRNFQHLRDFFVTTHRSRSAVQGETLADYMLPDTEGLFPYQNAPALQIARIRHEWPLLKFGSIFGGERTSAAGTNTLAMNQFILDAAGGGGGAPSVTYGDYGALNVLIDDLAGWKAHIKGATSIPAGYAAAATDHILEVSGFARFRATGDLNVAFGFGTAGVTDPWTTPPVDGFTIINDFSGNPDVWKGVATGVAAQTIGTIKPFVNANEQEIGFKVRISAPAEVARHEGYWYMTEATGNKKVVPFTDAMLGHIPVLSDQMRAFIQFSTPAGGVAQTARVYAADVWAVEYQAL